MRKLAFTTMLLLVLLGLALVWWRQGGHAFFVAGERGIIFIGTTMVALRLWQKWVSSKSDKTFFGLLSSAVVVLLLWFTCTGAGTWTRDIESWIVAVLLCSMPWPWRQIPEKPWKLHPLPSFGVLRRITVFPMVFWLALGANDWVREHEDFSTLRDPDFPSKPSVIIQHPVALALSGGGYRAALFHAGVVQSLNRRSISYDIISSVSGGSIFATAIQRDISPERFVSLVASERINPLRRIASPTYVLPALIDIAVPWNPELFIWRHSSSSPLASRTYLNAATITTAFGQVSLNREGYPPKTKPWIIGLTDLRARQLIGASQYGTLSLPIRPKASYGAAEAETSVYGAPTFIPCRLLAWEIDGSGVIVAASGAFPGAFDPISTQATCGKDSHVYTSNQQSGPLSLVDGGLADNSGVVMLQAVAALARGAPDDPVLKALAPEVIIASDGSSLTEDVGENVKDWETAFHFSKGGELASIEYAADLLYSFSGFPFTARGSPMPTVVTLSPKSLMTLHDPGAIRYNRRYVDTRKLADLILTATDADLQDLVNVVVASDETWPREELNRCISASREAGESVDSKKCFRTTVVALRIDRLLEQFLTADTLKRSFSEVEAKDIFKLGEVVTILQDAHLKELAALQR